MFLLTRDVSDFQKHALDTQHISADPRFARSYGATERCRSRFTLTCNWESRGSRCVMNVWAVDILKKTKWRWFGWRRNGGCGKQAERARLAVAGRPRPKLPLAHLFDLYLTLRKNMLSLARCARTRTSHERIPQRQTAGNSSHARIRVVGRK
jgi:hypothetical protein